MSSKRGTYAQCRISMVSVGNSAEEMFQAFISRGGDGEMGEQMEGRI